MNEIIKSIKNGIETKIKCCFMWELSTEDDLKHIYDKILQINSDFSQFLTVFRVQNELSNYDEFFTNSLIFYCDINQLLIQIYELENVLLNSRAETSILINVSPDLDEPEIVTDSKVSFYMEQLKDLKNQLLLNKNNPYFDICIPDVDLCFVSGCLLNYPIIYTNNQPDVGNCLSFIDLRNFTLKINDIYNVYSFTIPEKFYKNHFYQDFILEWYENIQKRSEIVSKLQNEIVCFSLILT